MLDSFSLENAHSLKGNSEFFLKKLLVGELLLTGLPPDGASVTYLQVNSFSVIVILRLCVSALFLFHHSLLLVCVFSTHYFPGV